MKNNQIVLIVAKIVYHLIMTGVKHFVDIFLKKFDDKFKFGSIVHGPGIIKFYGLTIEQFEDMSSTIHSDDKLNAIECFPLSRIRRRQADSVLNNVEKSSYMSVNSSLGWLGIAAYPLCSFYASHLQQKMPSVTVNAVKSQTDYLRLLKSHGTLIRYPSPPKNVQTTVSILVFSDAGRTVDHGQLSFLLVCYLDLLLKIPNFIPSHGQVTNPRDPLNQLGQLKYWQHLKQSMRGKF